MNVALILAGGTGTRVGGNVPKQYIMVQGKPVIAYTLELYQNNPTIDKIEIVVHKDWTGYVEQLCKDYSFTKVEWICCGGATFQESTMNGVFNLNGKIDDDDIIVMSYGASPMTPFDDIEDSIKVCLEHGNAIASSDITLCTCIKDDEFSTTQNILRETLKGFSTPWTFRFGELRDAYKEGIEKGILDNLEPHTTSLYLALGKRLWFSQSTTPQCKITYKEDIDVFEGSLLLKKYREEQKSTKQ